MARTISLFSMRGMPSVKETVKNKAIEIFNEHSLKRFEVFSTHWNDCGIELDIDNCRTTYITIFPTQCSWILLHGISQNESLLRKQLEFAEWLAEYMKYSHIILSTNYDAQFKVLESCKYKKRLGCINPNTTKLVRMYSKRIVYADK
jgi:hypothetical protein